MVIRGEFTAINGINYLVEITNDNIVAETLTIGQKYNYNGNYIKISFSGEPVIIQRKYSEGLITRIVQSSMTLGLVSNEFSLDFFFCKDIGGITIRVYHNGDVIFDGYVVPNTYNQPYSHGLEEIQIECCDKLSALKYHNFHDVHTSGEWAVENANSSVQSFKSIISSLSINDGSVNCFATQLKTLDTGLTYLECLSVNTQVFFGNEFDNCMKEDKVLEELLKYANLHCIQVGSTIYIYSDEDFKYGEGSAVYIPIFGDGLRVPFNLGYGVLDHTADDTNVGVDDIYTVVKVTDVTDNILDVAVKNPLEKGFLEKLYSRELYAREHLILSTWSWLNEGGNYYSYYEREGANANRIKAYHFVQCKTAPNWRFGRYDLDRGDYIYNSTEGKSLTDFIKDFFFQKQDSCGIFSWGSVSTKRTNNLQGTNIVNKSEAEVEANLIMQGVDNTEQADKLKMTDMFCIFTLAECKGVNGSSNYNNSMNGGILDGTILSSNKDNYGIARYDSPDGENILSPKDDDYKTFLVIGGSLKLQKKLPLQCDNVSGSEALLSYGLRLGYTYSNGLYNLVPYDDTIAQWELFHLLKYQPSGETDKVNYFHLCEFYHSDYDAPLSYRGKVTNNLYPPTDYLKNDFIVDTAYNANITYSDYTFLVYEVDSNGDEDRHTAIGPDGNIYHALGEVDSDDFNYYTRDRNDPKASSRFKETAGEEDFEFVFDDAAYHHIYSANVEGIDYSKDNIKYTYCTLYDDDGNPCNTYKTENELDLINYLPIIECELIVRTSNGGYRLCEMLNFERGGLPIYKWFKLGEEPYYKKMDGTSSDMKIQTFTIGVDIALGEDIFEKERKIKDTTGVTSSISKEGLKIEIPRYIDGTTELIKGKIEFRILGSCALEWDETEVKKKATWYRHTKYSTTTRYLMNYVHAILVSNLEITIEHESNVEEEDTNRDLVTQCADSSMLYQNEYSTEFKIITQPTTLECQLSGLSLKINKNVVYKMFPNGDYDYVTTINKYNEGAIKPEVDFVTSIWDLYNSPRLKVDSSLRFIPKNGTFEMKYLQPKKYFLRPIKNGKYAIETETLISLKYNTKTSTLVEFGEDSNNVHSPIQPPPTPPSGGDSGDNEPINPPSGGGDEPITPPIDDYDFFVKAFFEDGSSITYYNYNEYWNEVHKSESGSIYNDNGSSAVAYWLGKKITKLNTTNELRDRIYLNGSIHSLIIPPSVTEISNDTWCWGWTGNDRFDLYFDMSESEYKNITKVNIYENSIRESTWLYPLSTTWKLYIHFNNEPIPFKK